jgi:hypothetical protein
VKTISYICGINISKTSFESSLKKIKKDLEI